MNKAAEIANVHPDTIVFGSDFITKKGLWAC